MKTLTEKRTTASIKLNAALQQMLANITPSDHLDTIIYDFIQNFLLKDKTEVEDWEDVIGRIQWERMATARLLDFIILAGDHEHGDKLVCAILNTNKLSLEDFEEIPSSVENINLSSIDKIILKVLDLGRYFDQVARGEILANRFMNATIEFLNKNNNLETLQKIADSYEWKQFDVRFLRKIALWSFDHEHGYLLLEKVIPLNLLYLEDWNTNIHKVKQPHLKWAAYIAIIAAIKAFHRYDCMWMLHQLAPAQHNPTYGNYRNPRLSETSRYSCNFKEWMKIMACLG